MWGKPYILLSFSATHTHTFKQSLCSYKPGNECEYTGIPVAKKTERMMLDRLSLMQNIKHLSSLVQSLYLDQITEIAEEGV